MEKNFSDTTQNNIEKDTQKKDLKRTTLESLREEMFPYKDTLVLDLFRVVKLVGVEVDEWDYYWVLDDGEKTYWSSVLCPWSPLKGKIPDDKYSYLVHVWNLNKTSKTK